VRRGWTTYAGLLPGEFELSRTECRVRVDTQRKYTRVWRHRQTRRPAASARRYSFGIWILLTINAPEMANIKTSG